ncbi:TonB-dependent receptor domain-containing protein [Brevundimonas sp. SORGH_AS_0993]|uniref:TonB-dependent receptor family protein n=1 Tax=Brevundimonas sp. SORGH_AS_0993 TaxID=3041794 RepID=UPI00278A3535|nr:TonB-dependent receptor [Brevundimonas sp. SORGH_AS_0993]MDQ1152932.1 iron complex outermembrane receptor protein [Brevundimonas sp. SORGH_AS_0993]
MPLKTSSAPCALLLAALAAPAWAQTAAPTQIDSVIVTARRNAYDPPVVAEARARLSRTPGAVAVISAESYADRYAPNLADVLRDAPGVYAQKKWGGDIRLSIRGSGIGNASHNRGVLLAQDGVPFNEADGFGDFQLIDPLIARYTEVYKGGNALRFGGALLGGAVNLVTPSGRTAASNLSLRLDGGSFGTVRAHAETAAVKGDWDGFAAVTGQSVDGWRRQSEGKSLHLSANIGRRFGQDREVRLLVSGGDIHQEIPGSVSLSDALTNPRAANLGNVTLNYQRNMQSIRATVQTRWRLDSSTVFEGAVYGTWKDLDHPIFQVIDQESRNQGVFGRFDWQGQVFGLRADAFYGAWYRQGDLDAKQWGNLAGQHNGLRARSFQNAKGLDVFGEWRLFVSDRLALVVGGTWGRAERDYRSYAVPGVAGTFDLSVDKSFDGFAPRAGLLWEGEDGAQVFANVTRSIEPPNFSALSPSAGGYQPLVPQEAVTWEIGTRGRRATVTWDLVAYRADLEHELLNFAVNAALGVPAATFNAGPTVHQGIEAGLDWRIAPQWRLRQTYALSDFHFDGDKVYGDADLPVVPPHLYRAELRYDDPAGWFVAPGVEWSIKDAWVDYANTLKAPAYMVANLNMGWGVRGGLTVFADVRNLFDEAFVSNFSAVTDARRPGVSTAVFFPGEGRSAYVGVRMRY